MSDSHVTNRAFLSRVFLAPIERRLRTGWRLLGHLLLFIPNALFAAAFLFPLFTKDTFSMLGESFVRLLAITIPVYLARRFFDRRSFVSLGLAWDRRTGADLVVGFGISGVTISLLFLSFLALGWVRVEGFAWQVQSLPALIAPIFISLIVLLLSGWAEELMARGYWLQNLAEGLGPVPAVILSSVLFSLSHFNNPGFSWLPFLGLFVGGFDLAYGYFRTRRLWLSVGLHVGWNFFEGIVYGFPLSGLSDVPQIVVQSAQGPEIWTGGSFGPEAGLSMVPAVALNIALIYFFTRTQA